MSLIEQVDKWIIKMFKSNERETRESNAKFYPEGIKIEGINTDDDLVFGQFSSNNKTYYFTNTSFVIDNGQLQRIKIKDITATNGSFRSDHKMIYVEAAGKKINIKISDFPCRIQQLFYQLLEHHGSLVQLPIFSGLTRLSECATVLGGEDLLKFNLSMDTHTVVNSIELDQVLYYGELRDGLTFPDDQGIMVIKGYIGLKEIVILNTQTDGYNGVTEQYAGISKKLIQDFKVYKNEITRLIISCNYSIEDHEFDELKTEIGLKSMKEINNLYSYIALYIEEEGKLKLLTEWEAQ